MPICRRLLAQVLRLAASFAFCTAGIEKAGKDRDDRDHYQQLDQGKP